jgi:transcriptional regulator with XRE-family HTH domain
VVIFVEENDDCPGARLSKGGNMITGEQVKAARELLGWSQVRLSSKSGFGDSTNSKFERGEIRPSVLSLTTIKRTLEDAGVDFGEGEPGVKLKARAR